MTTPKSPMCGTDIVKVCDIYSRVLTLADMYIYKWYCSHISRQGVD